MAQGVRKVTEKGSSRDLLHNPSLQLGTIDCTVNNVRGYVSCYVLLATVKQIDMIQILQKFYL